MREQPKTYVVELEEGVWISGWTGDPGRTLDRANARRYATPKGARIGLAHARRIRPFIHARVLTY